MLGVQRRARRGGADLLLAWWIIQLRRIPRVSLQGRGRPRWWWLLASDYHRGDTLAWKRCAEVLCQQPPLFFAVLIPQCAGSWASEMWDRARLLADGGVGHPAPGVRSPAGLADRDAPATAEGNGARREGQAWPMPTWRSGISLGVALLIPLLVADLWIHAWRPSAETGWLVLIVAEVAALLTLPAAVWRRVVRRSSTIDSLLYDADNARMAEWLDRQLVPRGHLTACLAGVAVAVGGSLFSDRYLSHHFTVPYLIAIGVLGFLSVDVVRWVWRAPLVLRHVAARCRKLRINKLAPADTPSAREMSAVVAGASLYATIGIAIFAAPLVWMVLTSSRQLPLAAVSAVPMVLALATAAYLVFMPQEWITRMLQQHQLQTLEAIARGPFINGKVTAPSDDLDKAVALYQTFAAASTVTPEAQALTRKTAKVLLAVAPYAGAVAAKLLDLKVG